MYNRRLQERPRDGESAHGSTRSALVAAASKALNALATHLGISAVALAFGAQEPPPASRPTVLFGPADTAQSAPAPASDRRGLEVARRAFEAFGGTRAAERGSVIRFTFAAEFGGKESNVRRHLWDLRGRRDRVEFVSADGKTATVVVDLASRAARTWRGERETTDASERRRLGEAAYAAWATDSLWFALPLRLVEPGAVVHHDGELKEGGRTLDRVRVTFPSDPVLRSDLYTATVDRETGRVERWGLRLRSREGVEEVYRWEEWRRVGEWWFAMGRVPEGEGATIRFRDVAALGEVPAGAFP